MPLLVERDFLSQLGHEMRPLRSGTNEAHLTLQNVPKLGNLIDSNLANDATYTRRAIVFLAGPNRTILFGINSHRAKLGQHKSATVLADSFLLVKNRTLRLELDQHSRDQNDRQRENCANQCHQPVDHGARDFRDLRLASTSGEDQPRRAKHVQRNAAGNPFIKRGALFDIHVARQTQLQQLVCRQLSTTFSHRHDDTIDVLFLDDNVEILRQPNHAWIDKTLAKQFGVSADKADDAIAGITP